MFNFYLEPMMGFEPMTSSLPRKCSTTELHRLIPIVFQLRLAFYTSGAGDEARTRDLQLGRLSLYQLSYSRISTGFCGERRIRTSEVVRQQIYSLPHLATLVFPHFWEKPGCMSHQSESNQRPTDYKSVALPAELWWQNI